MLQRIVPVPNMEEAVFQRMVLFVLPVFLASLGLPGSVSAFLGKKSEINTSWGNVAIKGYDPVAYFTAGKPLEGSKEFETEWRGAKWRFANSKHLELFKADPDAYAPQYGGY